MARDGADLAADTAQLIASMFALLPIPVAVLDPQGRIVIANSSFRDVFEGISRLSTTPQYEMQIAGSGTFKVQTLPLNDRGFKIVYATDARCEACAEVAREQSGQLNSMSRTGMSETLTVKVPIHAASAREGATSMNPGKSLRGKSVMVIDDEAHVTKLIYDSLLWHGASIEVANSGSDAYEHVRSRHFDLIICGRLFPGLTGRNLYRLLESWMPAVSHRYLFISSDVITAQTWQFFSQVGVRFLRKPFGVQDLLESIESLFSQKQPQGS